MKDLPRVFVNPIDHEINNEQKRYVSFDKNDRYHEPNKHISLSKIDEILNSKFYIKKPKVKIVTDNEEIYSQIVTRTNSYVLTMDSKKIPINEIRDILII
ncbi:MAG: hypothetical protein J5634_01035 [Bacilli bacterium]|nr:hypothetical protein [Bacilli bacterium]